MNIMFGLLLGVRGVGFVSGPILSRSGVSDELTHITDWMPTLLHMAGADTTALELDGVNQWDSINTGSLTPREVSQRNKMNGDRYYYNTESLCTKYILHTDDHRVEFE